MSEAESGATDSVDPEIQDAPAAPGGSAPAEPAPVADEVLLAAVALGREALSAITPAATIGEPVGHTVEGEHVLSLHFAARMAGYPGWHWTVTLARLADGDPQVLETELIPGEGALLAPAWVPWAERMAEYRAQQEALAAEAAARGEEPPVDELAEVGDDEDDEDAEEFDVDDETGDDFDDVYDADSDDDSDEDDVADDEDDDSGEDDDEDPDVDVGDSDDDDSDDSEDDESED